MTSSNPFKGATPLERADKDRFFGRQPEQELLLRQVLSDRIVLVHAPTGAGKSSLVSASLLPALERRGFVVPRVALRPSNLLAHTAGAHLSREEILEAIARCFGDPGATPPKLESIESLIAHVSGAGPIVCVADQLEEIFTGNPNGFKDQACLFDCLGALSSCENVWLLLIVREDFLAPALAYSHFFEGRLRSRFAVPLLTLAACEEIILGTVQGCGLDLKSGRMGEICRQLSKASRGTDDFDFHELRSLPLIEPLMLQVICKSWFNAAIRAGQSLDETEIPQELVDGALAGYVDEAFRVASGGTQGLSRPSPNDEIEDCLRQWCEENLIEGGFRKQSSFPVQPPQGLDTLCSGYFISKVFGISTRLELSHDRFVEALVTSNRRWYERRSGFLGSRRREWVLDKRRNRSLLSVGYLLRALREVGHATSQDKAFFHESVRHMGRTLGTILALGVFPTALILLFLVFLPAKRKLDKAKEELEATRLKSTAMSLAGLSTLVSEMGRDSELGLALAIKALGMAKNVKGGGSYANGYARSVLFARTLESTFQRREILPPEVSTLTKNDRVSFDPAGNILSCKEGINAGQRVVPFVQRNVRIEPASGASCTAPPGLTEISTASFTIRANESHLDSHPEEEERKAYAFSRIRGPGKNTPERVVYLTPYSEGRVRVLAGADSPALEVSDKLLASSLVSYRDPSEEESYIYGLSLQRRGIGFFWRVRTEDADKCLAGRDRGCPIAELLFVGRLFGGLPVASWISPGADRFRALSNLGEVTEVLLRKPAPAVLSGSSYQARYILFCNEEGLLFTTKEGFAFNRQTLDIVNKRGVLLDPLNLDKPSFPKVVTRWPPGPKDAKACDPSESGQTIIAIGQDGKLMVANTPLAASGFSSPKKKKFWEGDGRQATIITPLGASGSLLVVANGQDGQLISRIVGSDVSDLKHDGENDFGGKDLIAEMGDRRISAVAFNGSLMAVGGSAIPGQKNGTIVFCRITGSNGLEQITQCTQVADVRGGVTSLSFSRELHVDASKSEGAEEVRGAFLAVGTTIGEVLVYAVPATRQTGPLEARLLSQSATHVGTVTGLSWAENTAESNERSQQLASGGVDGGVVIQEFPKALLRRSTAEAEKKDQQALGSPPPYAVFRHRFPVTLLAFDGLRLYVGGEDGGLFAVELDPAQLMQQACTMFNEGYTDRVYRAVASGGEPIDFSDICPGDLPAGSTAQPTG